MIYQTGALFFGEFSSYPVNFQTELKEFLPSLQFFVVIEYFPCILEPFTP